MAIHQAAARGFQEAERYDRSRPGYPPEAVERLATALGLGPGSRVLELGAGTGKFTRQLRPRVGGLVAVDPVEPMLRALRAALPGAAAVAGQAEAIPLGPGVADAVVCAQCFHWFDGPAALSEIHRVLAPGGRLGLVWNRRDESVEWVRRLADVVEPRSGTAPRYWRGAWRRAFEATPLFAPLEEAHFRHLHRVGPEQLLDRVASISFVAALPPGERDQVLAEVRRLLVSHPDLAGRSEVELPYCTDVFWCAKR